jgi:hypothetical protein
LDSWNAVTWISQANAYEATRTQNVIRISPSFIVRMSIEEKEFKSQTFGDFEQVEFCELIYAWSIEQHNNSVLPADPPSHVAVTEVDILFRNPSACSYEGTLKVQKMPQTLPAVPCASPEPTQKRLKFSHDRKFCDQSAGDPCGDDLEYAMTRDWTRRGGKVPHGKPVFAERSAQMTHTVTWACATSSQQLSEADQARRGHETV